MTMNTNKTTRPFIFWLPRILGVLFALFLMLFSLDVIEMGKSVQEIATGLFIHNVPALTLLLLVIIAWKYELVGAISFFLVGGIYILLVTSTSRFSWYMLNWLLIISGPAFIISGLFAYQWIQKQKN